MIAICLSAPVVPKVPRRFMRHLDTQTGSRTRYYSFVFVLSTCPGRVRDASPEARAFLFALFSRRHHDTEELAPNAGPSLDSICAYLRYYQNAT